MRANSARPDDAIRSVGNVQLRLGLVGAGARGRQHASTIAGLADLYEFVAVCDLDEGRAQDLAQRFGVQSYRDPAAFFSRARLDAVVIATPGETHHVIAKAAADHRVHMLIEVPLATTRAMMDFIEEVAEKAEVQVEVAENYGRRPAERLNRQVLQAGFIGRLVHLSFFNAPANHHTMSLFRFYAGADVEEVRALPRRVALDAQPSGLSAETWTEAVVTFENGVTATTSYVSSWMTPLRWGRPRIATLDGTAGYIVSTSEGANHLRCLDGDGSHDYVLNVVSRGVVIDREKREIPTRFFYGTNPSMEVLNPFADRTLADAESTTSVTGWAAPRSSPACIVPSRPGRRPRWERLAPAGPRRSRSPSTNQHGSIGRCRRCLASRPYGSGSKLRRSSENGAPTRCEASRWFSTAPADPPENPLSPAARGPGLAVYGRRGRARMLTQEENDLLTQTGPGTPGGTFLRSYWQPAALSEQLLPGGPPTPLRLFSEDLVMFRDEQGRVGLLDQHCSHRGTDLSYGRLEHGGLRCIYHGWLYDVSGRCLETPNEPAGSRFHEYVRHPAYPCREVGGVIFTYMGSGDPPLLPNYEVLAVPPDHRFATKHFHECNYLQGLEGNMDNTHVRFLHRFFRTEAGTKQLDEHPRDLANAEERSAYYRDPPPEAYFGPARVEETDFSVWDYNSDGTGGPDLILPSLCLTGGGPQAGGDGYQVYWRVPIDDTHHWLFVLAFSRSGPIAEEYRYGRSWKLMSPDYRFIRNKSNRYLQDREEQRTSNFTGMGNVFIVQDAVANESQGPVQNRTREMLGVADMSIVAGRKLLLRAIRTVQAGGEPPGLIRDPRVNAVDPIFLKRNAPPTDAERKAVLSATGGRWIRDPA